MVCLIVWAAVARIDSTGQLHDGPNKIRRLLEEGRYADAETQASDLFGRLKAAPGVDADGTADALDLVVEARVRNGRSAERETRQLAQQAVISRDSTIGRRELANSLRNLADLLFERAEYHLASEQYQLAAALHEASHVSGRPDLARDLRHLSRALIWADRSNDALEALNRAQAIQESERETDAAAEAETLELRALFLQRTGNYIVARPLLERAVSIRRALQVQHPSTASVLSLLGLQFWLEGDLVKSQQSCEEALSIAAGVLRPDHPEMATYMRNLAVPLADLGDLVAARTLRSRALAIAEKSLGPDHPAVAILLNDLAVNSTQEGDFASARVLYERALMVHKRRLSERSALATNIVYNLAIANAVLTNYSEARRQYNGAIEAWERLFSPNHPNVARALTGLGEMLSSQGLDSQAKVFYERSIAIRERPAARNPRDLARTLMMLSTTEIKLGHHARGLELSNRAVRILDESDDPDGRRTGDALLRHGALQAYAGDVDGAQASFARALSIFRRVLGSDHISVAEAECALAETLAQQERATGAIEVALEGEDTARLNLRSTLRYLPELQALTYGARRPKTLDIALLVVQEQPALASSVLDRVILGRSLVLDEIAGRRRNAYDTTSAATAPLWQALVAARQRLANVVVRGPGQQSARQYAAIVENARDEKDRAERALAEKSAAFSAELKKPSVGLAQVREALPERSALVSIMRYEAQDRASVTLPNAGTKDPAPRPYPAPTIPTYIALVLRQGQADAIPVLLGDAATVDELIARWRTETVAWLSRAPGAPNSAERRLRAIGDELRRRAWDPIATHLEGVEQVFVVPDGALNLLPLAALPVGTTEYLLERGPTIHYLSAERDLVNTDSAAIGKGLLALGGPSFQDAALFTKLARPGLSTSRSGVQAQGKDRPVVDGAAAAPEAAEAFRGSVSHCLGFQSLTFDPLPASGREANDVAGLWKEFGPTASDASAGPRVLVGRAADERSFKQFSPGHRVLHLATHGFFLGGECTSALDGTRSVGGLVARKKPQPANPKTALAKTAPAPQGVGATGENPLLLSGLALAGANRRAAATVDEEDGILTAEEVASLDLSGVEWAVLSACDTGLGEIKAGEGVFGLRRAFQIAGAHTVIMSLWSVEDRAAMAWMRALYEGRLARKLDTAAAVREASLTVLRQRRAHGQSTHPFYWAGFVASGDWR